MYTDDLNDVKLDTNRPEIRAWTELISLERIPVNIDEMKRLKEYEELHKLENQRKGKRSQPKKVDKAQDIESDKFNESQQLLLGNKQPTTNSAGAAA